MKTPLGDLFSDGGGPSATSADTYLVKECLRGNENAWAALIDKYKRLIYSIPVKYQASQEDAADIFQAVCLELFSELPKLRKADSLRSWLITVASHKCQHWKQKLQSVETAGSEAQEETVDENTPVPLEMFEEVEREQMLREAMGRLNPRCQEMIRLLFYETPALPYAEVAQRLGLATGSIGFIRGRCLKRMQQLLGELGF
jgi:RNA polymerase sigma factor (sigma-70 family)